MVREQTYEYKRGANNSGEVVWWKCRECKNSWTAQIYIRSKGIGCPYCANKAVAVGYNDFATKCPDLLLDWNYEKNNSQPQNIVWKSSRRINWKCKICFGEWEAKLYHRANGSGCPYCAGQKTLVGKNDIIITHPQLLVEWSMTLNENKKPEQYMAISLTRPAAPRRTGRS